MLSLILWVLFGWIVGSVAEFLWPPATPRPRYQTIAVGIAGSIAGGLVAAIVTGDNYRPGGLVAGVLGALACTYAWNHLQGPTK